MKYVDCIEMLNYALTVLKVDSREQVPVGKMSELLMVLTRLGKRMEDEESVKYTTMMNDLIQAIGVVQMMTSVKYINDNMKRTLADGFQGLKLEVAKAAYDYYLVHDFEPTEAVIPLMRDIVKTVSTGGIQI